MSEKLAPKSMSGHRERLRSRLETASSSVADYEILELVLGLALKRKDTKPLAKTLLERFGSFRGCLDATGEELQQVEGFGKSLANLWLLLREVMVRYAASPLLARKKMASPEAVAEIASLKLANLAHEESWLALVNSQNMLISWEQVARGSINYISIEPREIFLQALQCNASGIILVHNHPGGDPHPSKADMELTKEIKALAPKLGMRFLDHIIIGCGNYYSFERGALLPVAGAQNGK